MKKSRDMRIIVPVDVAQRYAIAEAASYLRISHASIYKEINARRIRVLKHGKRTFVPGSEIARLSRLEDTQDAPRQTGPAKPEPSMTTSYRLLDSRIHQALMRDIARQQTLWDALQKFDGKLQHLTHLVEKLGENASRREIRVAEISTPPQFLRLKEVMARVGLRVTTIYRYVARGAFPRPRKFGRSSLWVTAEVNDWIAKRTAGVPIEIDELSNSLPG
jgi:predicted DNA-binding transcriptional regulator AlpA/DNA-binding transcriptional MerR regulator